jgi:FkbH-like protein
MAEKVKLIIWDLDDTLWDGSIMVDPDVETRNGLVEAIKELNNRGVINSICSNNYHDFCINILDKLGIKDLFIMPNINYKSKGLRIKQMIKDFQLRDDNVLFVDDNSFNLTEAKHYNPNLQLFDGSKTDDILNLLNDLISENKIDNHNRFNRYKILETKITVKEEYESNEDFLKDSEIKVFIDYDIEGQVDRAHELVHRTNQLNYTKNRKDKNGILKDIQNNNSFLVSVKDKYGVYGVVGFIAYSDDGVKHFTFSCRILNMGVTDFIYSMIGKPHIDIVGEIAIGLSDIKPDWISETKEKIETNNNNINTDNKILFIGGCDLESSVKYLNQSFKIDTHFNYPSKNGIPIHRDSIDIIMSPDFSDEDLDYILNTVPFIDRKGFIKPNYKEYNKVVYSPLIDYIQGKYKSDRIDGFYMSCNPFFHKKWTPATLESFSKKRRIPVGDLKLFSDNWKPIKKSNDIYKEQLISFFNELSHCDKIIVLLGATTTHSDLDNDKYEIHRNNNSVIEEVSKGFNNVELINVDDFINGRVDFTNAIRHYSPIIYKTISNEINKRL